MEIRSLLGGRAVFWGLLYLPLVVYLYWYVTEITFYGEVLHWTGVQATRLLMLALAVTPLRRLFRKSGWTQWLAKRRRDIGVATFFYATAHTLIYLQRQEGVASIVAEGVEVPILVGWVAFFIFLVLAITSNDFSVKKLANRWNLLHRSVYVGAALTFAHWVLTAFDPTVGYIHLGLVIVLLAIRFNRMRHKNVG